MSVDLKTIVERYAEQPLAEVELFHQVPMGDPTDGLGKVATVETLVRGI